MKTDSTFRIDADRISRNVLGKFLAAMLLTVFIMSACSAFSSDESRFNTNKSDVSNSMAANTDTGDGAGTGNYNTGKETGTDTGDGAGTANYNTGKETGTDTVNDPRAVNDEDKGMQILLCLEDKGAKMYGASTCGHCSNQKKSLGAKAEAEFGRVYVECNPYAENSQVFDCIEQKIEAYPTWIFLDGTRQVGFTNPDKLQELSGCTDDVLEKY